MKKLQKHEMISNIIKDMEIIEEAYPELTETFEYQQLNCFRVEGWNYETGRRFNKAQLQDLSDRLEAKKAKLIFG